MLDKKVEKALNAQIKMEATASQIYLAMASWCDRESLPGCAGFLYAHSEEERMHMLKLVNYTNDSGGFAIIPSIDKPPTEYKDILQLFETAFQHEKKVSASIDKLVEVAETAKDKQTARFLQWYIDEQHEEETLYRSLLDRIKLIGTEGRGLYFIDKEVEAIANAEAEKEGE